MKYKYRKELIYHHTELELKPLLQMAKEFEGDIQVEKTNLVQQPATASIPIIKFTVQAKTFSHAVKIADELQTSLQYQKARLISETTVNYVYVK